MTDTTSNDAPSSFPNPEERDALVLEFQRLAARLARAGLVSRASSSRLMRSINRERRCAEDKRRAFSELVCNLALGIEDGTLKEREHFMRLKNDHVAIHLESTSPALYQAGLGKLLAREMRSLCHFGGLHFREVVIARSERVRFGPEDDRRRTVIVHLPSAYEFVGRPWPGVPSR